MYSTIQYSTVQYSTVPFREGVSYTIPKCTINTDCTVEHTRYIVLCCVFSSVLLQDTYITTTINTALSYLVDRRSTQWMQQYCRA